MRVTKQMLGNQTRKSILYLDQNFLSSVHRGGIENEWATALMAKVTRILDLQLLANPYFSTHIDESDLNGPYRDALVHFIQGASRGRQFEPYYRVEETQILKAFQRFLDGTPAAYQKEERDALCPSVHDWDGAAWLAASISGAGSYFEMDMLGRRRSKIEMSKTASVKTQKTANDARKTFGRSRLAKSWRKWKSCPKTTRDIPTEPAVISARLSPGLAKCTKRAKAKPTTRPDNCNFVLIFGRRRLSISPNLIRSTTTSLFAGLTAGTVRASAQPRIS